jgi:DNA-binding transcriptional LysR family regulator
MVEIETLRAFVAVAEAFSFAAGARRLRVSPPQASKLVARLEDRLGARLLNRTTRSMSLTDTGRAYLERARAVLTDFDALQTSVQDTTINPTGLLRLSMPVSLGSHHLIQMLFGFARDFPNIELEVLHTDRFVNLVEEGYDAAVRIGHLPDSSLIAKRLGETSIITCASPAYLAAHDEPTRPEQLVEHEAVIDLTYRTPFKWAYRNAKRRLDVSVQGRLRFSRANECVAAACAGFGLARTPAFVAGVSLRNGELRAVLSNYQFPPLPIHVVYPSARHFAPKVRALVSYLAERGDEMFPP